MVFLLLCNNCSFQDDHFRPSTERRMRCAKIDRFDQRVFGDFRKPVREQTTSFLVIKIFRLCELSAHSNTITWKSDNSMSVAKWISALPVISQHSLCLLDDPLAQWLWLQYADMAPPTEQPLQYFALRMWFERDEQSVGCFLFGG